MVTVRSLLPCQHWFSYVSRTDFNQMPSFGYLFYTLGFTDLVVFCCVRAYEEHQAKSFQMTHRLERLHDFRKKEKTNKQIKASACYLSVL